MQADKFKEINRIFAGDEKENVGDLGVAICTTTDPNLPNSHYLVSKFKLSPEEIEIIAKTGELWICTLGVQQPGIMPTVYNPFETFGMKPCP